MSYDYNSNQCLYSLQLGRKSSFVHNSDRDRNNKQGGEHGSALFFRTSGHPTRSKKLSAKSWESIILSKTMWYFWMTKESYFDKNSDVKCDISRTNDATELSNHSKWPVEHVLSCHLSMKPLAEPVYRLVGLSVSHSTVAQVYFCIFSYFSCFFATPFDWTGWAIPLSF